MSSKTTMECSIECPHAYAGLVDNRFHGGGYATSESRAIFCDECRLQRWLDVEAALATAQAEIGLIPLAAAERIERAARIELLDLDAIADGVKRTQHSLVPLLRALEPICGSYAAQYLHYGATTQDIQDTGQSLEFRAILELLETKIIACLRLLEPLALEHKEQVMVGRTHAQPALPITFGLKVASWIDELLRHVERIREARPRILVAQLYGGVGTMAAFRGKGEPLIELFAARLGLGVPRLGWHVSRDRVAEFLFIVTGTAQTVARIADEIRTLSRKPLLEVEECWDSGRLGSSTMPHKRNPEKSEQVVVLARLARAQVPLGLEAMIVEHERDYRGTRLEWPAIATVTHSVLTAMDLTESLLGGIIVHGDNMERNSQLNRDMECTEALAFSLGMRIGKAKAFETIHKLSQRAIDEKRTIREVALESEEVCAVMEPSRIEQILDPSSYLGSTVSLVEKTVAASRAITGERP